jgi:uncharacterized membrane protein
VARDGDRGAAGGRVSGAVTALGDTLFPAQAGDLVGRIAEDHGAGAHFLQRLRVFHPFIAVGLGLYVLVVANALSGPQASAAARRWGGVVMLGVLVQVAAGVINILLSAPGWLQVVHLLLGTGLWIALITFALTVLGPRRHERAGERLRGVVFDLDGTLYDKRALEWFMVRSCRWGCCGCCATRGCARPRGIDCGAARRSHA